MAIDTYVERFPSRVLVAQERIEFDAKNPEHRRAALKFFREGTWDIKFKSKWPCTTVPQTILMLLAEHACQKELKELSKENGAEFKSGDPFNMHTYRPREQLAKMTVADNVIDIKRCSDASCPEKLLRAANS